MRISRLASIVILVFALAAAALADTVRGTVTNGTTGKPAGGASVTLLDPMGGMAELATVKANAQGQFTIDAPPARGPRLARVERGGVNYFKMLTPGTASVELSVYDAAPSVEGIKGAADVVRVQTQGSTLQAVEMFAISNTSEPPRTLASADTFEFVLPDGAQIDDARAQAPNGQPISVQTKPASEKNHYAFSFALKPGETRLQIGYHLPYSGQASFSPRFTRDFEHFVLIMPTTMSFTAKDAKQFQTMNSQAGTNVEVSVQTQAGQDLSYAISGSGAFPDETDSPEAASGAPAMGGDGAPSGPGGGLGKPIDAPDGLAKYRWYILAALITVLVGGGIWTHERTIQEAAEIPPAAPPVPSPAPRSPLPAAPAALAPATIAAGQPPAPSNLLLAALKEEIFALEVEHQQGKLSPEEYDKARAALEQTLQRALTRTHS
jgi:hypothetical protein